MNGYFQMVWWFLDAMASVDSVLSIIKSVSQSVRGNVQKIYLYVA